MANPYGWDYPPGVTGREIEIAGPDWEGVLQVQCEAEDVLTRIEGMCPYEGDVEAWTYQHVTHWTCPLCGTEHEIDDREAE